MKSGGRSLVRAPQTDDDAAKAERITLALVGNPNTGKTTLFNALTGMRQHVANYPGVTVEKKIGTITRPGRTPLHLVDLPGTYSLAAHSLDEAITINVLLGKQAGIDRPRLVISIVDAADLARNLYLTSQILGLGVPVVVALNMVDLAARQGIQIDADELARRLGVPVVPIVASRGTGIDRLRQTIDDALSGSAPRLLVTWPEPLAKALGELQAICPQDSSECSRMALLRLLVDPRPIQSLLLGGTWSDRTLQAINEWRQRLRQQGLELPQLEAQARHRWIAEQLSGVVRRTAGEGQTPSDRADRVLTHPLLGMVILIGLAALVFQFIYIWAAPLMDAIDASFVWLAWVVGGWLPAGGLRSLVTDGIIAGVGSVIIFLPQILVLFFFIAVMEDCGYMARGALLAHRFMRAVGLGGQAFIPMISSFACAVPAIMAARVIDDRRTRLRTMLLAPLMSCSARLPVYTLLIAAFVPPVAWLGGWLKLQGVVLLGMYLVGIVTAIIIGVVLKTASSRRRERPPFLLELPPYRWPSGRTVLLRMYQRGRVFVVQAGTIILIMSLVVWLLTYFPRPAEVAESYQAERARIEQTYERQLAEQPRGAGDLQTWRDQQLSRLRAEENSAYLKTSLLGRTGRWLEPAVEPLGWDWKIGMAVLASFPAREVVVATLGVIYNIGDQADAESPGLIAALRSQSDEAGRPVYSLPVALSIMVFFALCCQCTPTLAALKRETNSWRWPVLAFVYMTALAYVGALLTYQAGSGLLA